MALSPEEVAGAAAAAKAAADEALMWKGVWLGAGFGLIVAAVVFVADKVFADFWYGLSFYLPKHKKRISGKGIRVYGLKGQSQQSGTAKPENLMAHFPPPGVNDGTVYDLSNGELRTKRNHDALLRADLAWHANGKDWRGTVRGRGQYFATNEADFAGFIFLVCDCRATSGGASESWRVNYTLRSKAGRDGWEGYWMTLDGFNAGHFKFGSIDLAT